MSTTTTKDPKKSGNPAKKAAAEKAAPAKKKSSPKKASSASDFKKLRKGRAVELPSGLVVMARKVGIQDFIGKSSGASVPNPLMDIVSEALEKGQKMDPGKMVDAGESDEVSLEMINEMMKMVDAVVMESVREPKIHPMLDEAGVEIPEEDRDENIVYVDEVDAEDKMFLFYWNTGGVEDVASFREEAAAGLASLAPGQVGEGETE